MTREIIEQESDDIRYEHRKIKYVVIEIKSVGTHKNQLIIVENKLEKHSQNKGQMNKIIKNMHKRNDIFEGPIKVQMYG